MDARAVAGPIGLGGAVSALVSWLPGIYPNAPKRNVIVLLLYLLSVLLLLGAVKVALELAVVVVVVPGRSRLRPTHRSGHRGPDRPYGRNGRDDRRCRSGRDRVPVVIRNGRYPGKVKRG